eukprot:801128-Rhodomonas_salina.1
MSRPHPLAPEPTHMVAAGPYRHTPVSTAHQMRLHHTRVSTAHQTGLVAALATRSVPLTTPRTHPLAPDPTRAAALSTLRALPPPLPAPLAPPHQMRA